jgi:hypothetical protein
MALWELKAPYRKLRFSRMQRWPQQLGLIFINSLLLRLIFPAEPVFLPDFFHLGHRIGAGTKGNFLHRQAGDALRQATLIIDHTKTRAVGHDFNI